MSYRKLLGFLLILGWSLSACESSEFDAIEEAKRNECVELVNAYKFHKKTGNVWFSSTSIAIIFDYKGCKQYTELTNQLK